MLLFDKISNNIASKLAKTLNANKDNEEVIAYGIYIVLDTVMSIGMVMIFGALFGVFFQALIISFTCALFRKTSGGAHATTSFRCAVIGTVVAVGFSQIIEHLKVYINTPITIIYLIVTFVISYYIVLKLAPKDSPNKRIVKEDKIKMLKLKSIRTLCIYAIICLIILAFNYFIHTQSLLPYIALICTGYLWQAFTLTSFGHMTSNVMEMPFRYIFFTGGENK